MRVESKYTARFFRCLLTLEPGHNEMRWKWKYTAGIANNLVVNFLAKVIVRVVVLQLIYFSNLL